MKMKRECLLMMKMMKDWKRVEVKSKYVSQESSKTAVTGSFFTHIFTSHIRGIVD